MSRNKAQITIFLIIALLLIVGAGLTIYFFTSTKKLQEQEVFEEVPDWSAPVKTFIESCMHDVSVEAVTKLGEHGGYIDMKDSAYSDRNFAFNSNKPTDSDGVSLSSSSSPIAYWWYMNTDNDCNNCTMDLLQPSLGEMEYQINVYVKRNLDKCMSKFQSFKDQGYSIKAGIYSPNATITAENVVITLDFPIEMKKGDSKVSLTKFSTTVDVNLNYLFDLGSLMILDFMDNQTIEGITIALLSYFSGTDFNMLPPIASIDHKTWVTTWQMDMVKMNLMDLLASYIPLIQIDKTLNTTKLESDNIVEQGFYNKLYFTLLDNPYQLRANMFYLDWPIYFDITPKSGKMLKPRVEILNFPLGISQPYRTNFYEFFYDVSYPIVVEIRDDTALNGKGYSLFFAFEVNIRDNLNLLRWHGGEGTIGTWDYGGINVTTGDNPPKATKTLICKDTQRLSGNISFEIKDKEKPVKDVFITFGCGDYRPCSAQQTGEDGKSVDTLPICMGGYLMFEKDGYMSKAIPFTTEFMKNKEVRINLEPFKYLKASVKKIEIIPPNPYYTINLNGNRIKNPQQPTLSDLNDVSDKDQILLMINRIRSDPYDTDLTQTLVFPSAENPPFKLVPGTYEITGTYIRNEKTVIRKGCEIFCDKPSTSWWGLGGRSCDGYGPMPDKESVMNQSLAGGIRLNSENGYWYVSSNDLDNSKEIEFYVLQVPTPTCVDDALIDEYFHCCISSEGEFDECCLDPLQSNVEGGICPRFNNTRCIPINEINKAQEYSNTFKNSIKPKFS